MAQTEKTKHDDAQEGHMQAKNLLNGNHRRVLAITLRRIELAAWHLEDQMTRGGTPELALTHFIEEPDAHQKAALLFLIHRLRQEIAAFAREYGLEVQEESFLRTTTAEFTLLWCDLEEVRPEKLRGYGPLPPPAGEMLSPRVQHLIELTLAVNEVAHGKQETIRLGREQAIDKNRLHEEECGERQRYQHH